MTLPLPNLDDRRFDDLLEEAKSIIPRYSKEWTNHNPSDPGITLIELFAWLSEMTLYRVNQVPEKRYEYFLRLLGIKLEDGESLDSGVNRALKLVSRRYRAVSKEDYEMLSLERMENLKKGLAGRAICVTNRNLEFGISTAEKPGHISVIIMPHEGVDIQYCEKDGFPTDLLKNKVEELLDKRRLVTTRVHVASPDIQEIKIEVHLALKENINQKVILKKAEKRIREHYHLFTGGPEKTGWPLGRNVYRSELYQSLEASEGVDYVKDILLNDDVEAKAVEIKEHQLISLDLIVRDA